MSFSPNISILRIAIDTPLRRVFDYLPPIDFPKDELVNLKVGTRIHVPFGARKVVGILLEVRDNTDVPINKLKAAFCFLDSETVFSKPVLDLCLFASQYYHHSLGEVLFTALPALLRDSTVSLQSDCLQIKKKKINYAEDLLEGDFVVSPKDIVEKAPKLTLEQEGAISAILNSGAKHKVFLLDGVTGSGKTEVYLQVIAKKIAEGRQVLVLVPEINLTPQTLHRFEVRFPEKKIVVLHSRLTDKARLLAWQAARFGLADIVIGTRSSLFTNFKNLGLIVLDEEHDLSFKQQSGLRYSARDLAVMRSKLEDIPLILGSATPSLESIANTMRGRYERLLLPKRVGEALQPVFNLVDIRKQRLKSGLSPAVIQAMEKRFAKKEQILLFVNRRGYAPSLICHHCGFVAKCDRCDVKLTLHHKPEQLSCHHCAKNYPVPKVCPSCGSSELSPCGIGTERLELGLKKLFPYANVVRIDSDTTRKKGSMEQILTDVNSGESQVLIGTQMLTKGHHFPDVTMVVIVNADSGLFSADFRASEYLAQLITQVSGRAGRASKPGEVYLQTHHPDHPLLLRLITEGYVGFSKAALEEREETVLAPFSHLALWRAESKDRDLLYKFLNALREAGAKFSEKKLEVLGPVAAVIERKIGLYHAQILFQTQDRSLLHKTLTALIHYADTLRLGQKVKWNLDVDPVETL